MRIRDGRRRRSVARCSRWRLHIIIWHVRGKCVWHQRWCFVRGQWEPIGAIQFWKLCIYLLMVNCAYLVQLESCVALLRYFRELVPGVGQLLTILLYYLKPRVFHLSASSDRAVRPYAPADASVHYSAIKQINFLSLSWKKNKTIATNTHVFYILLKIVKCSIIQIVQHKQYHCTYACTAFANLFKKDC